MRNHTDVYYSPRETPGQCWGLTWLAPIHQPLVSGIDGEIPLLLGTGHRVEVVTIVARHRCNRMVATGDEDDVAAVSDDRLIESAILGVNPLQGKALLRLDLVIVRLLEVRLGGGSSVSCLCGGKLDQLPAGVYTSTSCNLAESALGGNTWWIAR